MPPAAKKDISLIIFDLDKSDPSFFEDSVEFVIDISSKEWFFYPKNLVKLIFINSGNDTYLMKPHISEPYKGFGPFDPKSLKTYIMNETSIMAGNKANWLDGLKVGLEHLKQEIVTNTAEIISAQLIFISKFSNVDTEIEECTLNSIIRLQNEYKVKTIIAGPCTATMFIKDSEELKSWARNPMILDEVGKKTKVLLKRLCHDSQTVICNLKLAREVYMSFREKTPLQPWQEPLSFGTKLAIPSMLMRVLKDEGAVSTRYQNESGVSSCYDFGWTSVENEEDHYCQQDVTGGVLRWSKIIPMEDELKRHFKMKGPRLFTILGFTDRENIPETLLLSFGTSVLVPNPKDENIGKLIYLLYKTLVEKKKVGIASKVYAKDFAPKLVALFPDLDDRVILVNELAYADDIVQSCKVNQTNAAMGEPSDKTEKEVFEFVNRLNVTLGDTDFCLAPSLCFNPRSGLIARRLAEQFIDGCITKTFDIPDRTDKYLDFKDILPNIEEENGEDAGVEKKDTKENVSMDEDFLL